MDQFRTRVFYVLLASKFVILATVVFFWLGKAYTTDQSWDILHIILPLFATKITLMINFWLNKKPEENEKTESAPSGPIAPLTYVLAILYTLYFVGFITYYSSLSGTSESFAELKQWIGLAEVLFGTYLGLIVSKVYVGSKE